MRLERSFYRKRERPLGYEAPEQTVKEMREIKLEIGGERYGLTKPLTIPETFNILVEIKPIIETTNTFVRIIHEQKKLEPLILYNHNDGLAKDGKIRTLVFIFKEFLNSECFFIPLVKDHIIYERNFITQNKKEIEIRQFSDQGKFITDPPGYEQGEALWGYGGFYRSGCDLKDIEPIFFTPLEEDQKNTNIYLTRMKSWIKKGVYPWGEEQKPYRFMDIWEKDACLNLEALIQCGGIKVCSSMEEINLTYHSFSAKWLKPENNTLEINFKRIL